MSLFDNSDLEWYAAGQDPSIPRDGGSYVLVISVSKACAFSSPGTGEIEIEPGTYYYAGSAKGPGGLKSRLERHFKPDKTIRWHVDQLTTQGSAVGAYITQDLSECDLVDLMQNTGRFRIVQKGIGSSDCKRCMSHLFYLAKLEL